MGKRKMDSDLHRIKLEAGTVYQTSKNGTCYYRDQVQKARKWVSLGTSNQEETIRRAKALLPTVQARNLEIIAVHVKVARKLTAQIKYLPLSCGGRDFFSGVTPSALTIFCSSSESRQ